jgi:hypothetical protein
MTAGPARIGDGRAGDVARAGTLVRTAERDRVVALPELSAAELYMLCDGRQVLIEDCEYAWWYSLPPGRRDKLAAAAASLLAFRKLLRPPEASQERDPSDEQTTALEMAPDLSLVITARQQPTVLAVGTVTGNASGGAPRMYGLGEPDGRLRAVVAEQVTPQA